MKIFFSVGEPSGDLHGANLIKALEQRHGDVECLGFGGPRMESAGCNLLVDMTQLAIMWFGRALLHLPKFFGYLHQAEEVFEREKPDAVVLIDYPGFNWHVARRAKAHGIPVFYYGTPQLWAWASWRIKKMRRSVDHALCKLPFEETWYRDRGVNATYVGHPYFDELRNRQIDQAFVNQLQTGDDSPLVTILPGSRTQEVKGNLRDLLTSAAKVKADVPNVRFAVASFKSSQAEFSRQLVADSPVDAEVFVGRTPELISAATCTMAVSGSVSLELLYHQKPSVILYRVSRFAYQLQKYFRTVRYITLVNLLTADDPFPGKATVYDRNDPADSHVLMPEYLTCEDKTSQVAEHVVEWLTRPTIREELSQKMRDLSTQLAAGGASERAAEYILNQLALAPPVCDRQSAA